MSDAFLSLQRQAESVGRLIKDLNAADAHTAGWETFVVARDVGEYARGSLVPGGVKCSKTPERCGYLQEHLKLQRFTEPSFRAKT